MSLAPEKRFLRSAAAALKRIGVTRDVTILVALSGGADSVAMFHALRALRERFGYRIVAAHLNHAIRGDESDRDAAFVRELCARCGIDLIVERAQGLSAEMPNLEERAREARHAFLNAAADRVGAHFISLAHQADDQAETVLMRMLRGAGVAGLAAMGERGPGRIIRPMLSVTRAEVLTYLECIGEGFVNDSSNQSSAILRNRVRGDLMPMLEAQYAPGLRGRLVRLAAEMRAVDDFLLEAAHRELEASASEDGLDLSRFPQLHPALQAEVIRQFIRRASGSLRRIERGHIEAVRRLCLDGPPNGEVDLPGLRLRRAYHLLTVGDDEARPAAFVIRLSEGRTEVPTIKVAFEMMTLPRAEAPAPANRFEALFDASQATGKLTVRNFRSGDRIAPLGMTGHRKVQDIFVDRKVAVAKRGSYPIVELDHEIAWLPGLLRGRVGLVTEASQNVMLIRATEGSIKHPLR
ncbi:MAG TPA: tRNA lysidine(34) synthetase TilS [Candidatus Binataceae bacterium]|nr:tRNA lysidine(34) synthetase TilS [Candidatus Binataceae bacterium]